jgi:hypothetical protein
MTRLTRLVLSLLQAQKTFPRLVLEWNNVQYTIKDRTILDNVSGRVEGGEMLAGSFAPQNSLFVFEMILYALYS